MEHKHDERNIRKIQTIVASKQNSGQRDKTTNAFPKISPQHFISPPLHMCIGLVNKVWYELIDWMNDDLEQIEEGETIERDLLSNTNIMLRNALQKEMK